MKLINNHPFTLYKKESFTSDDMLLRSESFYKWMDKRRTCRDFSDKPVPREVIENILLTASTAPSGAHKQPWTFCVVHDAALKQQIRTAAEAEEKESYD
ncbi:MAG TPA: nitroreductase family protein, partial [Lacibacter sp.]|nr:nitroreductase family protein [Lacibacter sp.]